MVKHQNVKCNTYAQVLIRIKWINICKMLRAEPGRELTMYSFLLSKINKYDDDRLCMDSES